MKVLGIDPGTGTLGFGVVATDGAGAGRVARLVECGVIRTSPRAVLSERLRTIHEGMTELLHRHLPDLLAVEDIFFGTNVRTMAVLGHARGVILLAGAQAGVPIVEFSPAKVKQVVVGRGAALKPQVAFMVAKLLGLRRAPAPADAADGVAVAMTAVLTAGQRGSGAARQRRSGAAGQRGR
jgi:crossover junction endodeoxyribonuclease RuvC